MNSLRWIIIALLLAFCFKRSVRMKSNNKKGKRKWAYLAWSVLLSGLLLSDIYAVSYPKESSADFYGIEFPDDYAVSHNGARAEFPRRKSDAADALSYRQTGILGVGGLTVVIFAGALLKEQRKTNENAESGRALERSLR